MPKKKILYVHQDGKVTGSAISLRYFLSAIDREIFEPEVLLCQEGPARQLYETLDIKVHVFEYHTFWTFPGPGCFERYNFLQLKAIFPNRRFHDFILSLKPHLVHINDKAAMNGGISVQGTGLPVVQHSRSSYSITACKMNKLISSFFIKRYADHIICISEDETDGFEGFKNTSVIFNTVDLQMAERAMSKREDTRKALDITADEIVVGMMANINASKGAWSFLDMCRILAGKYPDRKLKFLLVGEASKTSRTILNDNSILHISPYDYVQQYIRENKLENKVSYLGFRKDNLDVMAAMDVLIVANSNGVLGRQPIEAQALGVPVIAVTGNSGKSSIVKNGITGTIISRPLIMDELINAVGEIIDMPEKIIQMRNAGIEYARENFSPAVNIKRIEAVYLNLLKTN